MSFSFDASLAASSSLSFVRMRLADTSSSSYKLEDEEITSLLSVYGNKYLAAAAGAEQLGAIHSLKSDKTIGKLSISQGSVADRYLTLAKTLRREAMLFATPFAGGISADQKASEVADSDRVAPAFSVGQFEDTSSIAADSTDMW